MLKNVVMQRYSLVLKLQQGKWPKVEQGKIQTAAYS